MTLVYIAGEPFCKGVLMADIEFWTTIGGCGQPEKVITLHGADPDETEDLVRDVSQLLMSWGDGTIETRTPSAKESPATPTNTGSPKLPTLDECYKVALESQVGQVPLSQVKVNMLRAVYDYICRQLRASA